MPVASGGMGEVYRAHDTRLGRDIVLKTLPTGLASDPGYMTRFRSEALVLASLNHPNVATIHGLEESGGTPEQVTHNGGYGAQLSPDGRRLHYMKDRLDGELWQAPADGGKEELVLRNCRGRNFQVLEDGIYLLDRGQADELANTRARALFYHFRTRQLEDLHFQTRKPVSPYGINLSADGKWSFYSEFEDLSSDLMLVENFR